MIRSNARIAAAIFLVATAAIGCTTGSLQTESSSKTSSRSGPLDTNAPSAAATKIFVPIDCDPIGCDPIDSASGDSDPSDDVTNGSVSITADGSASEPRTKPGIEDSSGGDATGESPTSDQSTNGQQTDAGSEGQADSDETSAASTTMPPTSTAPVETDMEIVSFSVNGGGTVMVEDGIFATYYDESGELLQSGTCSYADYSFVEVVAFAASFQTSLIERSPAATGRFLVFPLRVIVGGTDEPLIIENAEQLEARYEEVITAEWVAHVLEVDPVTVFCRYDGFMLGQGLLWADPTSGVFTIIHQTP